MARPRKPTELLKASGGSRADRHGARLDAIVNHADKPYKPAWLTGPAVAVYDEIVASMIGNALASSDVWLIAGAARWWCVWRKYDGMIKTGKGDQYKLVMLATMAWKNFEKCAAKLGLSPVDRARLQIEAEKPGDMASPAFKSKIVG